MLSTRDPLQTKGHIQTESEGMEKDIPCKWKSKESQVARLISHKIDFKTKTVTRDTEGHYIMIKRSIKQEDITVVNIYAPNIGAPKYIQQILTNIKREIDNGQIIQTENQYRNTSRK